MNLFAVPSGIFIALHISPNITNPFVTGQCRRIFLYLHQDVIFSDLNWLQLYSSHSLDRSVGLITNRSMDGQILHMHQRIIKFTEECAVDEWHAILQKNNDKLTILTNWFRIVSCGSIPHLLLRLLWCLIKCCTHSVFCSSSWRYLGMGSCFLSNWSNVRAWRLFLSREHFIIFGSEKFRNGNNRMFVCLEWRTTRLQPGGEDIEGGLWELKGF